MDVRFRQYLERLRCLRIKSDLGDLSPGSGVSRQSGARAVAPDPTSLAPGARMTVVKHTPSKYFTEVPGPPWSVAPGAERALDYSGLDLWRLGAYYSQ